MATVFDVKFQIVKVGAPGSGSAFEYRREERSARVMAEHVWTVREVLKAHVSGLLPGEMIEVTSVEDAAIVNLYEVRFEVAKPSPPGSSSAWQYRKGMRKTVVQAASIQDLPAVLSSDVSLHLQPGEIVDILSASQVGGAVGAVLS